MKKIVLKGILGYAVLLTSFASSAQVISEENFQTFGDQGYILGSAPKDNSTCAGQPDEKTLEFKRTYPSGKEVVYNLINAGVSSSCAVKGGTLTTITKVGSNGYIEFGKLSENKTTNLPGSLTIAKLPYVGTITFNASWTGGSRTGTPREGKLYKSTDNSTWTDVDVVATDPQGKLVGFFGDVYGATYTAVIDGSYFIKFESVTDITTENRYRLHDLTIDATAVVSVKDLFVDGSASVLVNEKTVLVKSASKGLLEIVGMDGKVLHSKSIAAGSEESLQVGQSGMYVVRLVVGSNASVQKIIVQ